MELLVYNKILEAKHSMSQLSRWLDRMFIKERKRQGEERSIMDSVFQVKNWRHQMKPARGKFVKNTTTNNKWSGS